MGEVERPPGDAGCRVVDGPRVVCGQRGYTTMANRRKFIAGLGALATGSAAAVGTGAFTSVSAERSVTIDTADDAYAFLRLNERGGGETPRLTAALWCSIFPVTMSPGIRVKIRRTQKASGRTQSTASVRMLPTTKLACSPSGTKAPNQ